MGGRNYWHHSSVSRWPFLAGISTGWLSQTYVETTVLGFPAPFGTWNASVSLQPFQSSVALRALCFPYTLQEWVAWQIHITHIYRWCSRIFPWFSHVFPMIFQVPWGISRHVGSPQGVVLSAAASKVARLRARSWRPGGNRRDHTITMLSQS